MGGACNQHFKTTVSFILYLCIESVYFKGEAGVWKVEVGGGPAGDTTGFLATLPEALGGLWVECLGLREMRLGRQEQGQSQRCRTFGVSSHILWP